MGTVLSDSFSKNESERTVPIDSPSPLTQSIQKGHNGNMKKAQTILDKDIREPLFDYLDLHYGKNRIIEEKSIGKSRADVLMVLPGKLMGLEIKSDADTYARIETQVKDYDIFFDENMVVVGSSHAAHVGEHIPIYWGILSVELIDDKLDFYMVREPSPNPKLQIARKIKLLWRPELAALQKKYGLYAYAGKSKDYVQKYLLAQLSEETLQEEISEVLFERDYDAIKETIDTYRVAHGAKPKRKRKYKRKRI